MQQWQPENEDHSHVHTLYWVSAVRAGQTGNEHRSSDTKPPGARTKSHAHSDTKPPLAAVHVPIDQGPKSTDHCLASTDRREISHT